MNTNINIKRILCFGDSLTWGYIPGTARHRYPVNKRFTGILQDKLGNGFEIIEEGLNSRGIKNGDPRPGKEGRSAMDYILPCLDTHDPLDLICVLLGTNELKYQFGNTPEKIGEYMEQFLQLILERKSQFRNIQPKVLLITPPFADETNSFYQKDNLYKDAGEKSKQLPIIYKSLSEKLGVEFLDITDIATTGEDGIHFTEQAHYDIGGRLYEKISIIFSV